MERLTRRNKLNGNPMLDDTLTNSCQFLDLYNEYNVGQKCPANVLLTRLCEYEDTGLTPAQINEMRKSANIKKIIGVPKSGAKVSFLRVEENGIVIDGILCNFPILVKHYFGEKVKVRIVDNNASVFDLDTGEQIIRFNLIIRKIASC